MVKELTKLTARFLLTMSLFTIATVHTLIIAVPDASRPGAISASIIAALLIAMYDIGVFKVDIDHSYFH